jgi:hypothetical protein
MYTMYTNTGDQSTNKSLAFIYYLLRGWLVFRVLYHSKVVYQELLT